MKKSASNYDLQIDIAKLMLLWGRNTDKFLHFETTFYLQGDLLERLKKCMEEDV